MCVSVYDLDADRVGRHRPSAGSIVHTDLINIISEDEQCTKGGDMLERVYCEPVWPSGKALGW